MSATSTLATAAAAAAGSNDLTLVGVRLIGEAFDKGLSFRMGQTHVQKYLPELLHYIENGDLRPEAIISHRMKLADAAEGYKTFNEQQDGCRKVVLTP